MSLSNRPLDVAVIGGGLVGLATARAVLRRIPDARVTVYEKEAGVGRHQSGHNSGVLHAGLYYSPGSLKARLAVTGIRSMRAFCDEHGIPYESCGKLVIANGASEQSRLDELERRGRANGLTGLRRLSTAEAREIEPHVRCDAALHVPEEGIVDYPAVSQALAAELIRHGATVRLGQAFRRGTRVGARWRLEFTAETYEADFIINCAGLYSDRVARACGATPRTRIVPFRGEYFMLAERARGLVRHLIYPTPDPRFPFLGVHFTRMIHGGVECGPNAILALHREGYRWSRFSASDMMEALTYPGLWRFLRRYPSLALFEVARSALKPLFLRSLRAMIPDLGSDDLVPGGAGVRAQAMSLDGSLIQDFSFDESEGALHVINAPSPAATASLAIGDHIAAMVAARFPIQS